MKRNIQKVVSLVFLMGILITNFATVQAAGIEPRYVGINYLLSSLNISSGVATCKGTSKPKTGYTVDLLIELKQDGTTIKTWTASGGGTTVNGGGVYSVKSNHDYIVTTTATVYDEDGKIVEITFEDSEKCHY